MKHALTALLLLMAAPLCSQAENMKTLPDSVTHKIDSAITALMKTKKITGASIGIVYNGQMTFAKGYGHANLRKGIKASPETIYGIGSITKTFTALAIMKLRDEGKIDLDKPASYYIKDLTIKSAVETGELLKIRNLLTHTSGLTDGVLNFDACAKGYDVNTVVADLNRTVLVHKTNWRMSYSNVGFDLLGIIVERVSGMKYEQYIKENFLDKMEMTHSGFYNHPEDTLFSRGYTKDTTETPEPVLRDMPAGRLFCPVTDMGHFMQMMLNYGTYKGAEIMKRSTIEEMETNHLSGTMIPGSEEFGYGLFIEPMMNKEDDITGLGYGHAGDTHVFHSTCFMFPKIGLGIVILDNSENGHSFANSSLINLFNIWMKRVKGIRMHRADPPQNTGAQTASGLTTAEIAGTYATGTSDNFTITRINDKKADFKQGKFHILLTRRPDGYYTTSLRILFVFHKKIPGMLLGFDNINGQVYMKELDDRYFHGQYGAVKDNPAALSDNWKKAAGKYKVLNSCEGNRQGLPQEIMIKGNKIYLKMKFDDEYENYSFNALDDTTAAIDGIDRYSGMVMKLESDGKVYFSGYEMEKE